MSLHHRLDAPDRTVDVGEARDFVEQALREKYGQHANLSAIVNDDRERWMGEQRRRIQSTAAATAQDLLQAADLVMNLAGNAAWNSPAGLSQTTTERVGEVNDKLVRSLQRTADLRANAEAYEHAIRKHVAEADARRAAKDG